MRPTQISLTAQQRRILDEVAASTGRSISSLIRDAVDEVYGTESSYQDDLTVMHAAFGSWRDRPYDGATWVERVRYALRS